MTNESTSGRDASCVDNAFFAIAIVNGQQAAEPRPARQQQRSGATITESIPYRSAGRFDIRILTDESFE